jgi:hypothetical protein
VQILVCAWPCPLLFTDTESVVQDNLSETYECGILSRSKFMSVQSVLRPTCQWLVGVPRTDVRAHWILPSWHTNQSVGEEIPPKFHGAGLSSRCMRSLHVARTIAELWDCSLPPIVLVNFAQANNRGIL